MLLFQFLVSQARGTVTKVYDTTTIRSRPWRCRGCLRCWPAPIRGHPIRRQNRPSRFSPRLLRCWLPARTSLSSNSCCLPGRTPPQSSREVSPLLVRPFYLCDSHAHFQSVTLWHDFIWADIICDLQLMLSERVNELCFTARPPPCDASTGSEKIQRHTHTRALDKGFQGFASNVT